MAYPSGTSVAYSNNAVGRPVSAVDTTDGITFASNAHYSPSGDLAFLQTGAGISSTYIYNNRLQPCRIYSTATSALSWNSTPCTATPTPASILDFKYDFGPQGANNGNISAVTNNIDPTRSLLFSYDPLNRLLTAQTSSGSATNAANCWAETYSYDSWGNLYALDICPLAPRTGSYDV